MREMILIAAILVCPLMMLLMMRHGHGHGHGHGARDNANVATPELRRRRAEIDRLIAQRNEPTPEERTPEEALP